MCYGSMITCSYLLGLLWAKWKNEHQARGIVHAHFPLTVIYLRAHKWWPACGLVLCRACLTVLEAQEILNKVCRGAPGQVEDTLPDTRLSQKHCHAPYVCVCIHVCKEGSLRNANKTQPLTQRLLEELGITCLLSHPCAVMFLQLHSVQSTCPSVQSKSLGIRSRCRESRASQFTG